MRRPPQGAQTAPGGFTAPCSARRTAAGFARTPAQHFFLERYEEAYLAEMRAFVEMLTDGSPATPGIRDGLQAQILADAATRSFQSGQPVDLAG